MSLAISRLQLILAQFLFIHYFHLTFELNDTRRGAALYKHTKTKQMALIGAKRKHYWLSSPCAC